MQEEIKNNNEMTLEKYYSMTPKERASLFESLPKRHVKRPKRKFYGVGFLNNTFPVCIIIENRKIYHPAYQKWSNMMRRCYGTSNKQQYHSTVDPIWHFFTNFLQWWWDNVPDCNDLQLDKDIKRNNPDHIYSPEFCSFVSPRENLMCERNINRRNNRN